MVRRKTEGRVASLWDSTDLDSFRRGASSDLTQSYEQVNNLGMTCIDVSVYHVITSVLLER